MSILRTAFASAAVAALLLPAGVMAGGDLTRVDFERCNQQAMQMAGISDGQSPAASPSMSGSGTGASGTTSGGAATGSSGTGTSSGSGAGSSGSMSGHSGSTSGGSSTLGGSTTGAGVADREAKLDRAVQAYRACLQQ